MLPNTLTTIADFKASDQIYFEIIFIYKESHTVACNIRVILIY